MDSLNFHHLRYFWVVAREGGLVRAAKSLRLSHPTLSAQIHALEEQLGVPLFTKSGRRLALTETGRLVQRYAEDIFSLGREMVDAIEGRAVGQALRLAVGVADSVPKLMVRRLLEPALRLPAPVRLVCHEDRHERLLAELAVHSLDLVLSDAPVGPGAPIRAYNHLLGQTEMGLFATRELARHYRRGFPGSLAGAPMLLPLDSLPLRRLLNQWLDRHDVRPRIVAEFEDSALLKVFGSDGVGIFPAPLAIREEVEAQFGVELLGELEGVSERFYAISIERRLKHPAILAITADARDTLFAGDG